MKTYKKRNRIYIWLAIGFLIVLLILLFFGYLKKGLVQKTLISQTKNNEIILDKCSDESKLESIKIAAFNIEIFGQSKTSNAEVMKILIDIVSRFDLVLIQEIRDSEEKTADIFLELINKKFDFAKFAYTKSSRLGTTKNKESYAYFYDTCQVELLPGTNYVYIENGDVSFEREPYIATFKSGNFDFTLVGIHTKPKKAKQEINSLAKVVADIQNDGISDDDIIVLGDLNADGDYFNENDETNALKSSKFFWLISNDIDTMVASNNTYDRIIILYPTINEYVNSSASVFDFGEEFEISDNKLLQKISDHFPVFAEFKTNLVDDD